LEVNKQHAHVGVEVLQVYEVSVEQESGGVLSASVGFIGKLDVSHYQFLKAFSDHR